MCVATVAGRSACSGDVYVNLVDPLFRRLYLYLPSASSSAEGQGGGAAHSPGQDPEEEMLGVCVRLEEDWLSSHGQ
jgi:hypothetical protein